MHQTYRILYFRAPAKLSRSAVGLAPLPRVERFRELGNQHSKQTSHQQNRLDFVGALTPDLVSGERLAVGAYVRDNDTLTFVPATRQLCSSCLGGTQAAALLELIMDRARGLQPANAKKLHHALGQYVELGSIFDLAGPVPNCNVWVAAHVLPRGPGAVAGRNGRSRRQDPAKSARQN